MAKIRNDCERRHLRGCGGCPAIPICSKRTEVFMQYRFFKVPGQEDMVISPDMPSIEGTIEVFPFISPWNSKTKIKIEAVAKDKNSLPSWIDPDTEDEYGQVRFMAPIGYKLNFSTEAI